MKKNIRELVYKIYEENIQQPPSEEFTEEFEDVEVGDVRIGNLNGKTIMLVVVDDDLKPYYECFKISPYWELGTSLDVLYEDDVLGKQIIEVDINFYLSEDELKKFKKVDQLDKEFIDKLLKLRDGEKVDGITTGLNYLYENEWVRKFKDNEIEIVKDYHLRIFSILDELEEEEG